MKLAVGMMLFCNYWLYDGEYKVAIKDVPAKVVFRDQNTFILDYDLLKVKSIFVTKDEPIRKVLLDFTDKDIFGSYLNCKESK